VGPKERKEREKEHRREEIIKAGEKLFLKKGLYGTTMDEIARKCELSKGTLYLYFSSKEQLYFEIVCRAMDRLYHTFVQTIEGALTPLEKLARIGEGYFRFFKEEREYFRILVRLMDIDHDFNSDLHEIGLSLLKKNNEVWGLITNIIIEGMKEGTFKPDTDPLEIAISLYASSSMVMQILDHVERNGESHNIALKNNPKLNIEEPFSNLDFEKIIMNLGWRIVSSIMTNPSDKIIK
jgi:AcrR family transcriptional regulator